MKYKYVVCGCSVAIFVSRASSHGSVLGNLSFSSQTTSAVTCGAIKNSFDFRPTCPSECFNLRVRAYWFLWLLMPAAMFLLSTFFVLLHLWRVQSKLLQASQPSTACENEMTVEQYVVLHESYVKCGSASAGEN